MIGFESIAMVLHILVSVVLIVVVLLQSQQSMNLSGLMGGASQSALGSQPQTVLSKVTTGLAIVFFLTAIFFALIPAREEGALSPGKVSGPVQQGQGQGASPAAKSGQETASPQSGSSGDKPVAGPAGSKKGAGGAKTPSPPAAEN